MLRNQIKLIAIGLLGVGLSTTTMVRSASSAEEDIQKRIDNLAKLVLDQSSAFQRDIREINERLDKIAPRVPRPDDTARPPPVVVKKVVHIHRHYHPCCEPCWYWY